MALYDAFVSYSHAKDKPIAAALQSVVQQLGKPWYRRRALRVFRDDTSLSATPSLWPSIEQALGQFALPDPARLAGGGGLAVGQQGSRLLARPQERRHAVDRAHRRRACLGQCRRRFRLARGHAAAAGADRPLRERAEMGRPRAYRDGADPRDARFIEAGADFAAAIHGMPKEDLLSQEVRQQRRALTLAWSAAGVAADPRRRRRLAVEGRGRRRALGARAAQPRGRGRAATPPSRRTSRRRSATSPCATSASPRTRPTTWCSASPRTCATCRACGSNRCAGFSTPRRR